MKQNTSPNHNNDIDMGMDMDIGIDSEDLLYEIFVRLPPISLVRFKYVSKSWYSLISNLDFLVRHWNNNIDNNLLLLGPSGNPVDVIDSSLSIFRLNLSLPKSISTNKDEKRLVLNNSCNGLLLYHQYPNRDYNVSSNNSISVFYVCNPITKQYIKIPNIKLKNVAEEDECKKLMKDTTQARIVFDPSISLAYKVIRCYSKRTITRRYCNHHGRNCLCRNNVLYVYSSETHSWKLLTSFSGGFNFGFRSALVNGVFYWYTSTGNDCLCFDVEKEKVWFIRLPTKPMNQLNRFCLYFGECSGQLCLIEKYHDINLKNVLTFPCSFDIMELVQQQQEDQRHYTWRVKYHVNMDPEFDHLKQSRESLNGFIMHLYRSTTGKKRKEEEALLMNIVGTDMVVAFNLTNNTFGDKVIEIPNLKNVSKHRNGVPYTPTLFPVHL